MFLNSLKSAYLQNKDKNPLFVRTVLKETIQYYILNFVSQSIWTESFIFKGGTCLRFFFGLPRLSEDLDFDIVEIKNFNLSLFLQELRDYFLKKIQFDKLETKLANNNRTIYLKFPVLREVGLPIVKNESNILFVRIDLAPTVGKEYKTEISIKSTYNFSILIKRYSLPDLFAGKIAAILTREAFEGKIKKARFKGRDFYDLIWFLEKEVVPNWKYLKEITGFSKREILKRLDKKINETKSEMLQNDLIPFFEDSKFIKNFCANFKNLYKNYRKRLQ